MFALCATLGLILPSAAGAEWQRPVTVSPVGTQYSYGQDVSATGDGLMVWSAPLGGGLGYGIHSRTLDAAGDLGPVRQISTTPTGGVPYTSAHHPTVRFVADGTATIVWLETTYGSEACFAEPGDEDPEDCEVDEYVRARQIAPNGSLSPIRDLHHNHVVYPADGSFGGGSASYVAYGQPLITGGPGGTFTVLWTEAGFGPECSAYGYSGFYADSDCEADASIVWRRLAPDGAPTGSPVVTHSTQTTGYGSGEPLIRMRAAAAADGVVTVVFGARINDDGAECWGGESAIQVLRIGADGSSPPAEQLDSGCGASDPALVAGPAGEVLVAWGWQGTYTADEARYARIAADGSIGEPQPLLDEYEGGIAGLDLARGLAGSAVAVWSENGVIRSRQIPPSGSPGEIRTLAEPGEGGFLSSPRIALSNDGSGAVVWEAAAYEGYYETAVQGVEIAADGTPGQRRVLQAPQRWDHGARIAAGAGGSLMASWRLAVPSRNRIQAVRLSADAPVANDDFADAEEVAPELPSFAAGSNEGAGREVGEPEHAGGPGAGSVWYSWTAEESGPVSASTCTAGGLDSLLAVYTGTTLGSLDLVASADGGDTRCAAGDSRVRFEAQAGTTYRIAVDGRNGTVGGFGLRIRARSAPSNDAFATPRNLGGGNTSRHDDNIDAGVEPGEGDHAGDPGGASVWYSWTPYIDGEAVISVCGYDLRRPVIAAYAGSSLAALTEVGSAVAPPPATGPECNRAEVRFEAQSGTNYRIAVDGVQGTEGNFRLQVGQVPFNDDFGDADQLYEFVPSTKYGSTAYATREEGEPEIDGGPGGASLWYSWTPEQSGTAVASVCMFPGNSQALLGIYTGDDVADLDQVAVGRGQSAPARGCNTSLVEISLTYVAGTTYRFAVDAVGGAPGSFSLALEPLPANDDFADAQPLGATPPQYAYGSNRHASGEEGEPEIDGDPGGGSLWYSWTPQQSGTAFVSLCMYGGTKASLLGVYTGNSLAALDEVGADRGVSTQTPGCYGSLSEVSFEYVAGTTYRFVADGEGGSRGYFNLTLDAIPANDDFLDARPLGSTLPQYSYDSNRRAGHEDGEPAHGPAPGTGSVWYSWTAPADGAVTIAVCRQMSQGSAQLGVYTGAEVDDLTPVGEPTSAAATNCYGDARALRVEAQAGVTYRIAVDGTGEGANHSLQITGRPANDDFVAAQSLGNGLPSSEFGSNGSAGREPGEPQIAGYTGGASVWYSWTAPQDQRVTALLCGSFGPVLGVYVGSSVEELSAVAEAGPALTPNCSGEGARVVFEAEEGVTYRIAVDSAYGGSGSFQLHLRAPPSNDNFAAAQPLATGVSNFAFGDNFEATREDGEPAHAPGGGGGSVWYSWTPNRTGPARVGSCYAYVDHVVDVYTGAGVDELTPVSGAAVDPNCPNGASSGSAVDFTAVEGVTYMVAVEGVDGDEGGFAVAALMAAENDEPDTAVALESWDLYTLGSNFGATAGPDEPPGGGASVWYSWTAPSSERYRLSTCDSGFDTRLRVFSEGDPGSLQQVAENDDAVCPNDPLPPPPPLGGEPTAPPAGPGHSRVAFDAVQGTTYYFAVDGKLGAEGIFVLELGSRPEAHIVSGPASSSPDPDPSFTYTATRSWEVDRFECSLDGDDFATCPAEGVSFTDLPDGPHSFRVRVVSSDGEIDPTPATWDWEIDTVAPGTALLSGPAGAVPSSSATFQFVADPPESVYFECSLDSAPFGDCWSGQTRHGLAEGSHTFRVRAVDAAGNVDPTPEVRTWTVDTIPPDTALGDGPSGAVAVSAARFGFSGLPPADVEGFECALDGGWFMPCEEADAHDYDDLPDGSHTFRVRAVDAAGNVDPSPEARTWTIDTTPPNTTIVQGPPEFSPDDEAEFELEADEPATFECGIDGGPLDQCEVTFALSELADGPHTLVVRATDLVGNVEPAPLKLVWTVDTRPPETSLLDGPEGTVAEADASFSFEADEPETEFVCELDGEAQKCSSPRSYAGLADGEHSFAVHAVDRAGNVDPTPQTRSWTVDTTPPDTAIDLGPEDGAVLTDEQVAFTYAGQPADDVDRFECALDGAGFAPCPAEGVEYTGLADGHHFFWVRALDAVGNIDPEPAQRAFRVESRPPQTMILSGPSGSIASAAVSFSFAADEEGSTFICRLDEEEPEACESPRSYEGLSDGPHDFAVWAIDVGGNADPEPALRTFVVDTTAPDTEIDAGPAAVVGGTSADFDYSGVPTGDTSGFECALDSEEFAPCSPSGRSYSGLEERTHSFRVRAVDAVGNADETPAEHTWTIDFTTDNEPPETTITHGPSGVVGAGPGELRFSADEPDSRFECALDGGDFESCESPLSYADFPEGPHSFAVRAIDPAGNPDPTPDTRSWTVDLAAPDTEITAGPAEGETMSTRRPEFAYLGLPADDVDRFECRLDAVPFGSCPAAGKQYPPLPEGEHSFEVRAVDAVDNADATPARRSFVVPANRAPSAQLELDVVAGSAPLAVEATVSGSDPDADPISYTLSFGDGSSLHSGATPPASPVSHTFTFDGSFQVRLAVSDGDATTVRTALVTVSLPEPLRADAGDDQRAIVGEPVEFDAGASRPQSLITRYEWDFGDGESDTGVRPVHTYTAPGTYTVEVSTELGANTETDTATVVVEPVPPKTGLAVSLTGPGGALAGGTVVLPRPDGSRQTAHTGSDGVAWLNGVADGSMAVYATAPGHRAAAATATVVDGEGELEIELEAGEPGATTLESRRLTYDEIIEAGIDVGDPENSHVYEAKIHLFFVPDEEVEEPDTVRLLISEGALWCYGCTGGGGGGGGGGLSPLGNGFGHNGYRYYPEVIYVNGEPLIQWLVLPIRASFLKEFFEVKLIVQNLTKGLTFSPGAASLSLPYGLSLAPTAAPQTLSQGVEAIPSGESRTVDWVIRGDVQGKYDLSADYSSSLAEIGESVHLRARTREQLRVWGAEALKMRILVDAKARRWAPYRVDVEFENVADVPVYNLQVEMLDREADAPEREALFFYAPFPPQVQGKAALAPEEKWTAEYVVYPGLGNEQVTQLRLVLEQSFVERTGGDVDLAPELDIRKGESLGLAAGPVTHEIDRTGEDDEAVVSWSPAQVDDGLSIEGYQLWTRQSLDRGKWELHDEVDGTSIRIPSSLRSAGRYYAVGTKASDGKVRFGHQLGIGPSRYVALGDSFSSGEGVPAFEPDTDGDGNECHRSERGAYSRRLVTDESISGNILPATFAACSGAVTRDFETDNPDNEGELPQLSHLSDFTNLVTLSLGGNDIGFGDVAALCLGLECDEIVGAWGAIGSVGWANAAADMWNEGSFYYLRIMKVIGAIEACANPVNAPAKFICLYKARKAMKALEEIADRDPQRVSTLRNLYNGVLRARLVRVYEAVAERASNARILVQLYPQIATGGSGSCELYPGLPFHLNPSERVAISSIVTKLNEEIVSAVAQANDALSGQDRFMAVEADGFQGHELCNEGGLNPQSYFNSIVIPGLTGSTSHSVAYSFHPNAFGHQAFADGLAQQLNHDIEAGVTKVMSLEQVNAGTLFVPFGARSIRATSAWPGSTVTMTLHGPGGEVISADTPGVRSGTTETSEWLEAPDPAPGTWTVRLFGDDVPAGGEPTQVTAYADVPPPVAPEVDLSSEPVEGQVDTFDLTASGPVGTEYEWTFSDGGTAQGATVRHSFPGGQLRWAAVNAVGADGGEGWFTLELGAPTVDEDPPQLLGVSEDQVVEATGIDGAPAEYEPPLALDAVDGEVEVTCTPPPGTVLPLGEWTVTCEATDAKQNRASGSFKIRVQDVLAPDTTPPDTQLDDGPGEGETVGPATSFAFSGLPAEDVDGFECRLDGAEFAACPSSGIAYSALPSGAHTFRVRAIDATGNADQTPAVRQFVVDADAPETTLTTGPSGTIAQSAASFSFSSEVGATFQCRLDGEQFAACGSPKAYQGLADGSHQFAVRAVDGLGNVDPTPATRSFSVDTQPAQPPEQPPTQPPSQPPAQDPQSPAQNGQPSAPGSAPAGDPVKPGGAAAKPGREGGKSVKCRKGFKKKTVQGKTRCVKAKGAGKTGKGKRPR